MAPHIAGLRARGFDAFAVQLPRGRAEAAVATYRATVPPAVDAAIGGQSFGGGWLPYWPPKIGTER